jgi:hypothetical protein
MQQSDDWDVDEYEEPVRMKWEKEETPDDIPEDMSLTELLKFSQVYFDEYKARKRWRNSHELVRARMDEINEDVNNDMV